MSDAQDLLPLAAVLDEPDSDAPVRGAAVSVPGGSSAPTPGLGIASTKDAAGIPVHRGWSPTASHHRWLEPFVLMALAGGSSHGYAMVGILTEVGISQGGVDVGQVYRTLRDLEQAGQVVSSWTTGTGAARRDYTITDDGSRALDEWAAVMKERQRLIAEFDAVYLGWVFERRRSREPAQS